MTNLLRREVLRIDKARRSRIERSHRLLSEAHMLLSEACELDRDAMGMPGIRSFGLGLARATDAIGQARKDLSRIVPPPLGKGFAD